MARQASGESAMLGRVYIVMGFASLFEHTLQTVEENLRSIGERLEQNPEQPQVQVEDIYTGFRKLEELTSHARKLLNYATHPELEMAEELREARRKLEKRDTNAAKVEELERQCQNLLERNEELTRQLETNEKNLRKATNKTKKLERRRDRLKVEVQGLKEQLARLKN